jgi:hypothetical protein
MYDALQDNLDASYAKRGILPLGHGEIVKRREEERETRNKAIEKSLANMMAKRKAKSGQLTDSEIMQARHAEQGNHDEALPYPLNPPTLPGTQQQSSSSGMQKPPHIAFKTDQALIEETDVGEYSIVEINLVKFIFLMVVLYIVKTFWKRHRKWRKGKGKR